MREGDKMSERCAFEGNCPMGADIMELSGACQNNRGELCGRVAAYGMLTFEMEGLTGADDAAPIVGTFVFDTVPAGDPPLSVREEWVGVGVPVRHPDWLEQGLVDVSSDDARLSLLSQGKLDAASWFTSLALQMGDFTATFRTSDGTFAESEPVSSQDFFGAKLDEQVRTTIEES
jgi:hypothetical protein